MDANQLIDAITPEAYDRLVFAVETGKWPEGTLLSQEQRDYCMQAVMLYQSKHNLNADHMTVGVGGDMVFKSKAELKKRFQAGQDDIMRVNPNQE
ncbi:YeaC family protein [Vibrio furnissii]|uniref:YeaC family protein n=1 Tax=Vibrio furnissii TaxID=29494 RepID=UPI001EEA4E80|nr:YeaC family protein [Vibrio furnissii]MCG6266509.1 YeaC family protein [Vibrio furnissii]